ncbi:MAG TPA: glutaredoxin family protein, partial [Burkholderiaceae bacterium]|nr:glutaredoxin family protein [Burkholderiaceae bacterium]
NYGDRPPQQAAPIGQPNRAANAARGANANANANAGQARTGADASADAALPYELRQAAQRHPVTLYTTPDCPPCALARSHLTKRGIPFATREVRTQDDATAFHALGFADLSFPALSVGRERVSGFEPGGWDRLLDSAAYPKTSRLPPRWQAARAEPLAPPAAPPAAAAQQRGSEAIEEPQEATTGSLIDDTADGDRRRTRATASEQPTIRF